MDDIARKILFYAVIPGPHAQVAEKVRRWVARLPEKDHLLQVAFREKLAGHLYKGLLKTDSLRLLRGTEQERLKTHYYMTVRRNLFLMKDLRAILQGLDKKKVRVVLLQGISLLNRVYPDLGLRPLTDVDLWVREEDYSKFLNTVLRQGYLRDSLYPNTFRRGVTTLDVHTHVLWAERIGARAELITGSQDEILQETRVMDFEEERALYLGKYDEVMYLGLHALKHNVNQLIWLVDILSLVNTWMGSDWLALRARAKRLGQDRTLTYIFSLLKKCFNFQVPPEMRDIVGENRLTLLTAYALRKRATGGPLPVWAPLILMAPDKALGKRLSHALENLFPRPEILHQVFPALPSDKVWRLYLLRFAQLMKTAWASAVRRA
jgi:hypothetical protein